MTDTPTRGWRGIHLTDASPFIRRGPLRVGSLVRSDRVPGNLDG
jgi:hypothetical protein